ncbi:hypothetical protein BC830DRAFT_1140518 [Chytriomyces sp. MP71]|nr:hypothetical protein BC830DRAFT_1140518 [Chytriomyces sp. MP71]
MSHGLTYQKLMHESDCQTSEDANIPEMRTRRSRPTSAESKTKLVMPEVIEEDEEGGFKLDGSRSASQPSVQQSLNSLKELVFGSRLHPKDAVWKPSNGISHCGRKIADRQEVALICAIAQALFRFGAPLSRVEHLTVSAANALDIPLTIQCLPEILMISIGDGSLLHPTRTHFLKLSTKLNVGKLHEVDQLALRVIDSNSRTTLPKANISETRSTRPSVVLSHLDSPVTKNRTNENEPGIPLDARKIQSLLEELDDIVARPRAYPLWVMILSGAIHSSTLAMLNYSGSYGDGMLAFVLGALATLMCEYTDSSSAQGVAEILVAIVVSASAHVLQRFWPGNYPFLKEGNVLEGGWVVFEGTPACQYIYALSSLIRLFPGMSITLGMLEMNDNPVSGSVRMFQSFIRSLKLGYGMSIGSKLGVFILSVCGIATANFGDRIGTPNCPSDFSALLTINFERLVYSFAFACGSYIHLEAQPSQGLKVVAASMLSFLVLTLARNFNPVDVAAGFAAFIVASAANLWSRMTSEIAVPFILSAVQYLGPGSLAVYGAANMFSDDSGAGGGSTFAIDMIVRAMSIALGA